MPSMIKMTKLSTSQHDRLAAVEESVKEMNSMLNGADDTAILNALMSQVILLIMLLLIKLNNSTAVPNTLMSQVLR